MSQITENTIVIKKSDEKSFKEDYEKYGASHRVSNPNRVYTNKEISVYVFDANGDSPWEIESDTKTDWLALETNYLDGELPWTRIKGLNEDELTIAQWLKTIIPKEDYDKVRDSIEYSC